MKQFVGEHLGYKLFFENISYQCPALGLFGYSSERALKNAVSKKVQKLTLSHTH
jgi:hypothetical protein